MPANPTEAETRHSLIDLQLAQAGWNVGNPRQVVTELALHYPVSVNPSIASSRATYPAEFADYALLDMAIPAGDGNRHR